MNESELIQAARGGDEAAFEQLVWLHEKKIYNLCLRMCVKHMLMKQHGIENYTIQFQWAA